MLRVSLALYTALGLGLFALGVLYLTLNEFMPYHAEALQTDWSQLTVNYQGFIIGTLRALGAGAAVSGFSIAWMAVAAWRRSIEPYRVLLPAISIGYSGLLCWATWTVSTRTPGDPPLLLNASVVLAAILATLLLAAGTRRRG